MRQQSKERNEVSRRNRKSTDGLSVSCVRDSSGRGACASIAAGIIAGVTADIFAGTGGAVDAGATDSPTRHFSAGQIILRKTDSPKAEQGGKNLN